MPPVDAIEWSSLFVPTLHPLEIVVRAAAVYLGIVVAFRIAGRRHFSRLSTFDAALLLLLTVALRRTVVGEDSSLTSGFLALGTIFGLNRLLDDVAYRSPRLRHLLEGRPRLLVRDGVPDVDALRRQHIGKAELQELLREHGGLRLEEVERMWIERTGRVSIRRREAPQREAPH